MGVSEEDVVKISRWMESKLALLHPSYLAPPDTEAMELPYMKKPQKARVKMERKLRYEEKKRELLDPKKTAHRMVDIGGRKIESAAADGDADVDVDVGDGENGMVDDGGIGSFQGFGKGLWSDKAVSKEGLKGNLHEKLEDMRAARKASGSGKAVGKKKVKKGVKGKSVVDEGKSAVGEDEGGEVVAKEKSGKSKKRKKRKMGDGDDASGGKVVEGVVKKKGKRNQQTEESGGKEGIRVQFGAIQDKDVRKGKKGDKKSKQELLREAEEKVEKRKQFASSGEGGEEVMEEAWKTALDRTKGERVLDNPKLLRKNINRERKKRVKSAKQWQERIKTVEAKMAKRQGRAKANMKARTDKKMERRKMKRLKKLVS